MNSTMNSSLGQVHKGGPRNSFQNLRRHIPLFKRSKVDTPVPQINAEHLKCACMPEGAYHIAFLWYTFLFHGYNVRAQLYLHCGQRFFTTTLLWTGPPTSSGKGLAFQQSKFLGIGE